MFRDHLSQIIPKVIEYKDGSLEGETPSLPRGLDQYAFLLRFDPRLLDGKKVLDFGCGFSNIYAELLKRRVTPAKFVAVDRNPKVKQANPKACIVDGRNLAFYFNRGEFDICLALFSTYHRSVLRTGKRFLKISMLLQEEQFTSVRFSAKILIF